MGTQEKNGENAPQFPFNTLSNIYPSILFIAVHNYISWLTRQDEEGNSTVIIEMNSFECSKVDFNLELQQIFGVCSWTRARNGGVDRVWEHYRNFFGRCRRVSGDMERKEDLFIVDETFHIFKIVVQEIVGDLRKMFKLSRRPHFAVFKGIFFETLF